MSEPQHRTLDLPGEVVAHVAERGEGPLVVLVHGFPEGWWTWRSQLDALAAAGFRAAAVDVRGTGSSSPAAPVEAARLVALAGDLLATIAALGEREAVLVGHDWGSSIVSTAALLRPDVVRAVALLGVPYQPPGGPRPSALFSSLRGPGGERFYVDHLAEPGLAERELDDDPRAWLAGFLAALSAGPSRRPDSAWVAPGARMADRFPPGEVRPAWLTDALLDEATASLRAHVAASVLARYRNADRDWEDLRPFAGRPLPQPSLFVAGAEDPSVGWLRAAIEQLPATLPGLRGSHLLDGVGHWLSHEAPDELGALLTAFLRELPATG